MPGKHNSKWLRVLLVLELTPFLYTFPRLTEVQENSSLKKTTLFGLATLTMAAQLGATPTLITGTPGDSLLSAPTGPSLRFGTIYNFDTLTANTSYASYSPAAGISISSPDGLVVLPYSTQSGPNELFDNSAAGSASITITLGAATNEIGIGLADADGVTITLQALNAAGAAFGPASTVTLPATTVNPFNGYYAISDTGYDIYGLKITQSVSNANYSGLAIDDLQVAPAPEPASFALFGFAGAALVAFARLRRLVVRNSQ